MKNSKILILEDEGVISEHLKMLLNKSGYSNIAIAENASQARIIAQEMKPDLALLDVRINGKMEGIEFAKQLNTSHSCPFIFITAHSDAETLQEILDTKPTAFISKPFKTPDVLAAINIALHNQTKDVFNFKNGTEEVSIDKMEILFVKSEKNYIDIFCVHQKFTLRKSLDWFIAEINCDKFLKVHRSFIVNTKHIRKFSGGSLTIQDAKIPVSRNNFGLVKSLFAI